MKSIVSEVHLAKEIVGPFFVATNTSRKYGLFSHFSELIILLSKEDNITCSVSCGYGGAKGYKSNLEADNSREFNMLW